MTPVQIGLATLYCGDADDIRPELHDDCALVTDPIYGNGFDVTRDRSSRQSNGLAWGAKGGRRPNPDWSPIANQRAFDPAPWLSFRQIILWGGNHYAGLPPASRWLVWDKRCGTAADDHGDAELAWTNLRGVIRVHAQLWRGIVREGEENVGNGAKLHPFQKPIRLMRWCVAMTTGTVVDPYMGSGTTGVAAVEAGRPFIGVELDPAHFATACRRIEDAQRQTNLFDVATGGAA